MEGLEANTAKVVLEFILLRDEQQERSCDVLDLVLTFKDGSKLQLWDEGQPGYEQRSMRTDDTLSYYIGAQFLDVEVRDGPGRSEGNAEVREIQFLTVRTSKGVFVMSNHGEHDGLYGGFRIAAQARSSAT